VRAAGFTRRTACRQRLHNSPCRLP
jgi:hypothetical protein